MNTTVEEAVCRMSIAMGDPSYVRPKIWTGAKECGVEWGLSTIEMGYNYRGLCLCNVIKDVN